MRLLRRLSIATAALAALMVLMTATALAGGWAEVTIADGSEDPPVAGEEREIRFSVLQHGVTAVDFGEIELTAVHPETGREITVPATNHGGGRWSAIVTFPVEGSWQIGVVHDSLETSEPATFSVGSVDGMAWLPGALAVTAFGLAAVVLLGATAFIARRRRPSAAEPPATTVHAG